MLGLLLSVLHLLALLAFLSLFLPERYFLLNPFAAAADRLYAKLIAFLRSALPLPPKALSCLVLLLALVCRAALLLCSGPPCLLIGTYALLVYPAHGVFGWVGVELLHFAFFYLSLLTGTFLLRLFHLGKPLPGYSGDLLTFVSRPLSSLSLLLQGPLLFICWVCVVSLASSYASSALYPMAELQPIQDLFHRLGIANPFNLDRFAFPARVLFLSGSAFMTLFSTLQSFLSFAFICRLLARLFQSKSLSFLFGDFLKLLTGPIPPLMTGSIDWAPVVAFFLLGILSSILGAAWLLLFYGISYVV